MITSHEIKKQINDLMFRYNDLRSGRAQLSRSDKAQIKAWRKRIKLLTVVKNYLDTEPSEEFVRSEYDRVKNKIALRMAEFSFGAIEDKPSMAKIKHEYEKTHNIPVMREQLKVLKFILNKKQS